MFSKLSNYHCKELPVAKAWNSWFQTWKSIRYQWKDLLIPKRSNSWFLMLFCFVYWAGNRTFCFASWTGTRMFAFGSWQGTAGSQRLELNFCQRGNHRLPLQGTAGCQRLELLVPNLGTRGYHCKQLPVPTWEPQVTIAKNFQFPKGWNWWFPTWEPKVTMARNCRFPDLETYSSQPGNQRLPLQGIASSQKFEFMFLEAKQLSLQGTAGFPKFETHGPKPEKVYVTSGRICWFQKDRTHGS